MDQYWMLNHTPQVRVLVGPFASMSEIARQIIELEAMFGVGELAPVIVLHKGDPAPADMYDIKVSAKEHIMAFRRQHN